MKDHIVGRLTTEIVTMEIFFDTMDIMEIFIDII